MSREIFIYHHTIFFTHISSFTSLFLIMAKISFRVFQPMDLAPTTAKFFSPKTQRTSVMSWRTFTYSHTIFLTLFSNLQDLFQKSLKFLDFFMCISSSVMSWRTFMYTHTIFLCSFPLLHAFFKNISNSLIFHVCQFMGLSSRVPKIFSQKNFGGPVE